VISFQRNGRGNFEYCVRTLKYDESSYRWGFQIKDMEERHEWFKLELDPSHSNIPSTLAAKYPSTTASPPGYDGDVSSEKLVTDYLKALRQTAENALHKKLPARILVTTPREWIITIPAIWSDSAKQKMRTCAESAGMGSGSQLHIISEPEAAAIYTLQAVDPPHLQPGDTFIICDAGGG